MAPRKVVIYLRDRALWKVVKSLRSLVSMGIKAILIRVL